MSNVVMLLGVLWWKYRGKCTLMTKQDFPPLFSFHLDQMIPFLRIICQTRSGSCCLKEAVYTEVTTWWKGELFVGFFPLLQCWTLLESQKKKKSKVLYLHMSSIEESILLWLFLHKKSHSRIKYIFWRVTVLQETGSRSPKSMISLGTECLWTAIHP